MTLRVLADEIVRCRRCPRLVAHLEKVGRDKKKEFANWTYWAKPLPGSGDPRARLLIVGLAPAAHGGARTGRVFTGDSSAKFLFRALHQAGFASQPTSERRDDGLELRDTWISLAARCAPPENQPLPEELTRCRPYLVRELGLLPRVRVVVALGKIAWDSLLRAAEATGWSAGRQAGRPPFGHDARADLVRGDGTKVVLLGSYHPSRQNTQTGRLTPVMIDRVFARARSLLD